MCEEIMVDVTVITDLVLGSLNAQVVQDGYLIYGMTVTNQSVESSIELARRNLVGLVGEPAYNLDENSMKYESYIVDMSCMRIVCTMLGVAISSHFNYKTSELSISKNANPSLEEMLRQYEKSINQWIRLILSKNWTGVVTQDDLVINGIVVFDGVSYIGRDADSLQTNSRR